MTEKSQPHDRKMISSSAALKAGAWVQTERSAHEAWARLAIKSPRASALMHLLVSKMGDRNAVVVPQKVLAKLMGAHERTIQRAIADLAEGRWIQVVRLNGAGTICAYVVNDKVAWGQPRDQLTLSTFSATVVADINDQARSGLDVDLRKIPMMYDGERQLPTGPGEDPPNQPSLIGIEPDLPSLIGRRIDQDTGEIL